jgi:translation initiation factor IF-1
MSKPAPLNMGRLTGFLLMERVAMVDNDVVTVIIWQLKTRISVMPWL